MGILDDAIRQHLELKRQHGAERDDLERLENEAFGPATRPGDPEFVDPDATADPEAPPTPAPTPEAGREPASSAGSSGDDVPGWLSGDAPTTVAPSTEGQPVEESPAEQARTEHAGLGDTADHPAPTQLGPADEAEPPPPGIVSEPDPEVAPGDEPQPSPEPAAAEPPEAPEGEIFGEADLDFGDLDFELDDEEPLPAEAPAADAPPAEPRAVTPTTTDHDLLPPAPVTPAPEREDDAPAPVEDDQAGEGEKSEEDLLEETPDFLREAPEGEDLWFEQGPPRDFDFDD